MKYFVTLIFGLIIGGLFIGCTETTPPNNPVPGQTYFESADPNDRDGMEEYSENDASAGVDGDADADGESASRTIEEADIIKIDGNTLYALSEYRGLVVIDISDPSNLSVLGRHPTYGRPFEMYLRDGIAYPIYSAFWTYVYDEEEGTWDWQNTSRIMALDVTDPESIDEIGTYDLAGTISDSRLVGDVIYAVAYESGWCWRCEGTAQTTITSLNIADPTNVHLVDRLSYEEDEGYGWRRSISVNTERMYVSGMSWDWDNEDHSSTIQVVDISNHSGRLSAGAQIDVAGQIESRWQMDEFNGVLRVISQPGGWWGSDIQPVVETFRVNSASDVRPLGELDMVLPRPEDLRSVRFDGYRGYAVTFERTDPLFVIDLSDPEHPVQRGELEIPGWLYHMEPRGDRLFAVGYDENRALAVSLFDVADADAPIMLDRVVFGSDWSWMVEDQDRIHKAFKILEDLGMILMPFAGWEHDEDYYSSRFRSGVQIIDFTMDGLVERGVLPHHGFARRAFVHNDRLFAMSDERIESFDFSDRDHPVSLSHIRLSRNVYRVAQSGDYLAELVSDWWTGEARLDVLPMSDPDGLNPVGSLDLSDLRPEESSPYYYWNSYFSYYDSRVFSHGDMIYLLWSENNYCYYRDEECVREQLTGVAVIDISDPTSPTLISQERMDFPFPFQRGWWWYGTVEAGESIVQIGSTLVVRQSHYRYWWDEEDTFPTLEIIDFSDPTAPVHASSFSLPGDHEMGTLQVEGDLVVTSHFEPVGDTGRVRFYLDRIDVSDPDAPTLLTRINIPGSPVWFDSDARQLVTVDYQYRSEEASSWADCREGHYYGDYYFDSEAGLCVTIERSLNLLAIEGALAILRDRVNFEDRSLRDVRVSNERIFVGTRPNYWYWWDEEEETVDPRPELITFTGPDFGRISERSSLRMSSPYTWLHAARGNQAIVLSDTPPALDLYDTSTPDSPLLERQTLLTGYGYDVHILEDVVISANSMWGVQVIPLF